MSLTIDSPTLNEPRSDTLAVEQLLFVRYGAVPEVIRVAGPAQPRGTAVVLHTPYGLQVGEVLQSIPLSLAGAEQPQLPSTGFELSHVTTSDDHALIRDRQQQADDLFDRWQRNFSRWNLTIELIDLELSLANDATAILYVTTARNADATQLALQAAAEGLGLVSVRPISSAGPVVVAPASGGCGSGGKSCGCSS